ncbi:hypothetical protein ABPG72_020050 [Tetrahymena utriculariae]
MEEEISLNDRIQVLHEYGLKTNTIYNHLIRQGISIGQSTVYEKVRKLKNGETLERKEYQRENEKLTQEMEEEIIDYFYADHNIGYSLKDVKEQLDLPICKSRLSAVLKNNDIVYKNIEVKPILTDQHKHDRLQFARKYLKQDWKNYLFVDETTFQSHSYQTKVWCAQNNNPKIQVPKYPIKVHAWAGICAEGITDLHLFEGTLDGEYYCTILEKTLIPSCQFLFGKTKWVLVQDNDPKHTCNKVEVFCKANKINILRDWPSSSPDINPIENIWGWIKNKLKQQHITTKEQLLQQIDILWQEIPLDFILHAIQSMPNRLQQVINQNGSHINY